jgi:endonuclease/exonuclease/phosphatase (EEP) superfamily protein YafD
VSEQGGGLRRTGFSGERSVVEDRIHKHWRHLAFLLAAGTVVVVAPLTLVPRFGWVYPVELFCHFQVQYLAATVACAAVLAGLGRWRWCVAAAGCAIVASTAVLPYQSGLADGGSAHAATSGGDQQTLRLLLANVLVRNGQHARVADLVAGADADVLVFQEVNDGWMASLADLERDYPHTVGVPRQDAFGIAVFSRVPLLEADVRYLGAAGRPSVALEVSLGGTPVSIVTTHPPHPLRPRTFALRNDQLGAVADLAGDRTQPLVLIGDLNVTMWSPWFRRLRSESQLSNARHGFGVLPSWPTFLPSVMRLPIDHCLVSDELIVTDCRLGPAFGSDHLPLIVDVALR